MFFYEIEGHMQKLSSFGRVKKIRPKMSLRLDMQAHPSTEIANPKSVKFALSQEVLTLAWVSG